MEELNFDPHDTEMGRKNLERINELEKIAQPLVDFVNKYCSPHDIIIIQQGSFEIYQGSGAFPTAVAD